MPKATVVSIENVSGNFYLLRVKFEPGFAYKAGQALAVEIPPDPEDAEGKPKKGYYSFASADGLDAVDLLVEKRSGWSSDWLTTRKAGDQLDVSEAMGQFVLKDTDTRPQVFIGSGAGIGPLRAMILTLACSDLAHEVFFFPGNAEPEPLFDDQWKVLAEKEPNFRYHPSANPATKMVETVAVVEAPVIYIAGFNKDVDPAVEIIEKAGFSKDSIQLSKFG